MMEAKLWRNPQARREVVCQVIDCAKGVSRWGMVQLTDATSMWHKIRKSLRSKRKELSSDHIDEITRLFGEAKEVDVDPDTKDSGIE